MYLQIIIKIVRRKNNKGLGFGWDILVGGEIIWYFNCRVMGVAHPAQ
jgi:hypothetical protein